jgi:hypothetical protein
MPRWNLIFGKIIFGHILNEKLVPGNSLYFNRHGLIPLSHRWVSIKRITPHCLSTFIYRASACRRKHLKKSFTSTHPVLLLIPIYLINNRYQARPLSELHFLASTREGVSEANQTFRGKRRPDGWIPDRLLNRHLLRWFLLNSTQVGKGGLVNVER